MTISTPAPDSTPPDAADDQDLIELARDILSRMTPEERAEVTIEGERLGLLEEYVILQALVQLADDPEVGVAGKA